MDIKTRYILFCDYALISSDGKLSIIGEFDHLFSSSDQPTLLKAFFAASLIAKPSTELNLSLQFIHQESKDSIFKQEITVKSNNEGKVNLLLGFENIKFPKFGVYIAQILEGKEKVGEVELHVMKVKQQKPAIS